MKLEPCIALIALNISDSEPDYSYKVCSYKKVCICRMKIYIFIRLSKQQQFQGVFHTKIYFIQGILILKFSQTVFYIKC